MAKFGLAFWLEFALPLQASLPPPCLTLPRRHTLDKFTLHTRAALLNAALCVRLALPSHTRQRQFRR
ncbi:hypothetical protein YZ58_00840 [Campylobacter upsaliensis]|nr:hypothetical protein [Campylobacter upsaliensis]